MEEQTKALICRIAQQLAENCDSRVTSLVQDVIDEALLEARARLKAALVEAIVNRAAGSLQAGLLSPAHAVPAAHEPLDDTEHILHEIEAIKAQICENERLISSAGIVPVAASGSPPSQFNETPPQPPHPAGARPPLRPAVAADAADAAEPVALPTAQDTPASFYYVYGIIAGDTENHIAELQVAGMDVNFSIQLLPYRTLRAVVSNVLPQEFGQEELRANMENMQWLQSKVMKHQQIIALVLQFQTVIPMKFGTIYRSEERVREMLSAHHDDFIRMLAYLEGNEEWGARIYCDRDLLLQKVLAVSDQAQTLKAEIDATSDGVAYFLKKKLQAMVADDAVPVMEEIAQRIHERIAGGAVRAVVNALSQHHLSDEHSELILNGAYLVDRQAMTNFHRLLDELAHEYLDIGLAYELTGPWPPYNFADAGLSSTDVDTQRVSAQSFGGAVGANTRFARQEGSTHG